MTAVLFIAGAYLWGSIPSAYLAARYFRNIDIREYGSGNVGAANVFSLIGKRAGWILGTFDSMGKGALPVFLANLLDQSLAVQAGTGLAAIAGHNWSPYIGFTGGRGVATAVGIVFGLWMWQEFLILTVVLGALGRIIFRESGFWTFVAMLMLPVLAYIFDRPQELVYMTLGIGVLLTAKRLTGNWDRPPRGESVWLVLVYRMLWDRDVARQAQWTERRPTPETERSSDVGA